MTDRWSATERIFHAALERPTAARAAFLAEACAGDDELRRDVQSLLDQMSSTDFLEQPALQIAAGLVTSASLAPLTGKQIGVYSIKALLGRGGMGEVYRALDTRLGREVAIKVLPRALMADPDRLARFEREARVLASLNHPHIGMLYGLEESGGHLALILELVEGDTLADRLARGPVPLKEALTWARQIADALDAAHEKGIVHRDLKPANIKITPEGVVKVLDFGLARTYGAGSEAGVTSSPTITVEAGAIIGTAAYMSPEQARGQAIDKRADVWAFGCVLYELLTGRLAFAGPTMSDTLAAVLHRDPDWRALPPALSPAVTTLLRRCLEKDIRQRRRDIGDVRAELDDAAAQPIPAAAPPIVRRAASWRLLPWAIAVAGVAVAAGLGAWASGRWSRPGPEARVRQITDLVGMEEMPAVSPDSKDVAFVAPVQGRRQIWLRRLGGGPAHQITEDDADHDHPRWTPDSSALVYFTPPLKEGGAGTLWEITAFGGMAARKLAQAATGADVSHKGQQLATFQKSAGGMALTILDRGGAQVKMIPVRPAAEYLPPRWSPDDRSIAFIANEGNLVYVVYVIDIAAGKTSGIATAAGLKGLAWLPDGSGLVYASAAGSTLRYPPVFTLRTVSRRGGSERQLTIGDVSYVDPDVVQPGKIFASRIRMQSDIWRFPVSGSPGENVRNGTQLTHQTAQVQTPSPSPDGREIAYLSNSGGQGNIWVANADGTGTPRPLTTESDPSVVVGVPNWSPTSDWIVYIKTRAGQSSHWLIKSDGSDHHLLTERGTGAVWSPDGRWVYFTVASPGTNSCVYKVPVEGGDRVQVRCDAAVPMISRDGTTLYYSRGPDRVNEIFKASPPDGEGVRLNGYAAYRVPWYPTGNTLSPDDRWIAAPLKDGVTTNIWLFPTDGGPMRQITDFGRRAILIARTVAWSRDSRSVYAAVAEMDADIVLLEGIGPTP
jgi:eukaryotic-like serine/threonine-protein kinase